MKATDCCVLFALFLSVSAAAEMVTLTKGDSAPVCSFNSATNWSDGLAAHPGADYLVENYTLRAPTNEAVFAGDSLTIRNSGLFSLTSSELLTTSNLYLEAAGRIHIGLGGSSGKVARVAGTLTVRNTASGYAYLSGRSNRLNVEGPLAGDGTLALEVQGTPYGSLIMALYADNANFIGKLRLVGCPGYETHVVLGHPNALAGRLPAFQQDAVLLQTNAALWAETDAVIPADSNRGLTVTPNSSLGVQSGKVFRVETAISGTTMRKEGAGRLELSADCLLDSIQVNNGTLALARPGSIQTVSIGGAASVELPAGLPRFAVEKSGMLLVGSSGAATNLVLEKISIAGGAAIVYDATDATQDVLTATGSFEKTGTDPVRIVFADPIPTSVAPARTLLRAPSLSASDFGLKEPSLPSGTFEVVQEASNAALLFRQTHSIVRQTSSTGSGDDGAARSIFWSDTKVPSSASDYINTDFSLYISSAAFPGHSLTLDGATSLLTLKNVSMTFPDLRLFKGRIHNGYVNTTVALAGSIGVYSSETLPFDITGNGNTIDCNAPLKGNGVLRLTMTSATSANFRFNLNGDNSAFAGKIKVVGVAGSVNAMRVGATGNNPFGGPLPTFSPDALTLTERARIMIDNDTVFDAANRGITIDGALQYCYFSVATGKTFRVEVPITGTKLYKNSTGNLILGAANTLAAFQLDEGSVEPRHAQALGTNTLFFANGTSIRLQAGRLKLAAGIRLPRGTSTITSSSPISIEPVVLPDETLPADFELPLFLLADGSTGLSKTILLKAPADYRTELKTRSVDDNGTALTLVYATFVRSGTMILLR